jgi:uridine phosphorylase
MGHEALTVCLIIANRIEKNANGSYHIFMENLIKYVLSKLTS